MKKIMIVLIVLIQPFSSLCFGETIRDSDGKIRTIIDRKMGFSILNSFYKKGSVARSALYFDSKAIADVIYKRNGEIKCIYGIDNFSDTNYGSLDIMVFENILKKKIRFESIDYDQKVFNLVFNEGDTEIKTLKAILPKNSFKMDASIKCEYSGKKLSIKYIRPFFHGKDSFQYGSYESLFSERKTLSWVEADGLVREVFKVDKDSLLNFDFLD